MESPLSNGLNVPDDIAVIGLACRFPGEASNEAKFWDLLCNGRCKYSYKAEIITVLMRTIQLRGQRRMEDGM
jgi:hypothetical protein